MQILIDSAHETPAGLRHAALLINYWAALTEGRQSDINGDGGEITLTTTETHTVGDVSHTVTHAASKRPTPPPIGPAPLPSTPQPLPPGNKPVDPVVHPDRHPDAPDPEPPFKAADVATDPYLAFVMGKSVPAGTNGNPTVAASSVSGATGTPAPMTAASVTSSASAAAPAAGNAPVSAPTGTSASSAATVDKDGIAWDGRVHSETRKLNADGTWRFRRNLDPNVKATVMAELVAAKQVPLPPAGGQSPDAVAGNVPVPPEAPPVPQQPVASNTVPTAPDAPVTLPAALPVQPAVSVGVPDPPNAGVVPPPVNGFRELMTKINVARAQGKLSQDQVDAACRAANIEGVTALAAQPALVPAVDKELNVFLYGVAA